MRWFLCLCCLMISAMSAHSAASRQEVLPSSNANSPPTEVRQMEAERSAFGRRIALVIGNAAYSDKPLRNPINDAQDVAAELRKAGFDVTPRTDLNRRGMIDAIRQFTNKAQSAQLALVYYSGHGMQSSGENYLIPTDARINDEKDVRSEGIPLRDLLGDLDDAKVQKTVVILDACRDNPYQTRSKGTKKGLTRVETAGNATVVAFATADGKTADDGIGRNGVYTTALLSQLRQPPQDIRDLLDETANAVARVTKDQKPKIYGDTGAFKGVYLAERGVQVASVRPEPAANISHVEETTPEVEAWAAAKAVNTQAGFGAYLSEFPKGKYASAARIALVGLKDSTSAPTTAVSAEKVRQPTIANLNVQENVRGEFAFLQGTWKCAIAKSGSYEVKYSVHGNQVKVEASTGMSMLHSAELSNGELTFVGRSTTHPEYGEVIERAKVLSDRAFRIYSNKFKGQERSTDISCEKSGSGDSLERVEAPNKSERRQIRFGTGG